MRCFVALSGAVWWFVMVVCSNRWLRGFGVGVVVFEFRCIVGFVAWLQIIATLIRFVSVFARLVVCVGDWFGVWCS